MLARYPYTLICLCTAPWAHGRVLWGCVFLQARYPCSRNPGPPTLRPTIVNTLGITTLLSGFYPSKALGTQPRVDARQSKNSIPRIYKGRDVIRQFPLPLTQSMAPTAEPTCSSKNLGWHGRLLEGVAFFGSALGSGLHKSTPSGLKVNSGS